MCRNVSVKSFWFTKYLFILIATEDFLCKTEVGEWAQISPDDLAIQLFPAVKSAAAGGFWASGSTFELSCLSCCGPAEFCGFQDCVLNVWGLLWGSGNFITPDGQSSEHLLPGDSFHSYILVIPLQTIYVRKFYPATPWFAHLRMGIQRSGT